MNMRLMATVLMLCTGAATGAELGRLFYTPEQRSMLDKARKQNLSPEIASDNAQKPAPPTPQDVSVDGVVRRSDDKNTVWLNNRPVTERNAGGINVSTNKNDSRVKLRVPESGRSVDLKVGQTVEIVSGTVQEGYARGTAPKPAAKTATDSTAPGAEKVVAPPASRPEESQATGRN